jgi:hypothetical protein
MPSTPRIVLPRQLPHLDAAETMFFQRELDHLLAESFDPKYADLVARQFVPVDSSIDPAAEVVRWESYDKAGTAKLIRDFSKDFPEAQVSGVENSTILHSYGDGFGYTIDELRAASRVKRPLDRMRADAAREVMAQNFDRVLSVGDTLAGFKGLTNLSSTLTETAGSKTGGGTAWTSATATAAEILIDLFALLNKVPSSTAEVERTSKRILLPPANLRKIAQMRIDSVSTTTVKQFFEENSGGATIDAWDRLTTANGSGGTRAICYDPNKTKVRGLVAIEFEMMAPQLDGMRYKVACRSKLGGVISPYPKSICYMDSI